MRTPIVRGSVGSLILSSLLAVTACTEGPESTAPSEPLSRTADELEVCIEDDIVHGIDVSYWQGDIDWPAVAGTEIKFAIARISDGDYLDTQFDTNWPAIKENGLIRGAYQYFRPMEDIELQAQIVIDAVGMLGPGDLPVTLDVEAQNPGVSQATYVARIQQWMDLVEPATGKKPMIYTGRYYWQDNVGSDDFADHVLWHAQYPNACIPASQTPPECGTCPNIAAQFETWGFWQFTQTGRVAGIGGDVDRNVFNGSYAELEALAGAGYSAQIVDVEVPQTIARGQSGTVRITLKNTGSTAWDENTALGTTEPRDHVSILHDASWPKDNRAANVTGTVAPDAETTLTFKVRAPDELGPVSEHFGLVQELVTWFGDAGGPADDAIVVAFEVTEGATNPTTSSSATSTGSGSAGTTGGAGGGPAIDDGGDGDDGCDCSVGDPQHGDARAFGALALLGVLIARRRRALG